MAADTSLGSPTTVADADNPYRSGYRDGFHDAREDGDDNDESGAAQHEPEHPRKSTFRRILPFAAGGMVLLAIIVGVVIYWLNARHYETSDDAFIDAHVANISSQISGRVVAIRFTDNEKVASGQTLIEIDPRDYQEKLDQSRAGLGTARAQLAQAQAQLALQQTNLDQAMAQVTVAEADSGQADQDLARYRGVDPRAVTRQDIDKISATARSSKARLEAARAAVGGARAQIDAARAQVQAMEASAREAQVNVDNAELQLSYARISAPINGRIAKRNVELGTYVAPGQALVAVVPPEMFVTANFKETQLTDMKVGDPVDIHIDAYPATPFHGRVDSFQTGTGSAFSTLPAENATGNYVKVVQRLPVKIVFDDKRIDDVRLAPGLSVEPQVKVR